MLDPKIADESQEQAYQNACENGEQRQFAPAAQVQPLFVREVLALGQLCFHGLYAIHTQNCNIHFQRDYRTAWFIDLSEAMRIDRVGYSAGKRRQEAEVALPQDW